MENIIIAIISASIPALASVIAVVSSNNKNNVLQDERIKTINENVENLTRKVEQHNNFGLQLAELKTRVEILERKDK